MKRGAGGVVLVLKCGKLMFLSQKLDLGGNQHACGKLKASSTTFDWSSTLVGFTARDTKLIFEVKNIVHGNSSFGSAQLNNI